MKQSTLYNTGLTLVLCVAATAALWLLTLPLAKPYQFGERVRFDDRRDPRCDTPARYEAMREGADCS